MNLEEELRSELKQKSSELHASSQLKERVMNQIFTTQGGKRMKKWLLTGILAAVLLIPTGAFAAYNYLADSMYGSQQNVAHIGGTVQAYEELEAKLQEAKQTLSDEEFTSFMFLLKEVGQYHLKIADSKGVLHPDQLSPEDHIQYTKLIKSLEPLFDILNQQAPSKTDGNSNAMFLDMKKAEKILNTEEFSHFKSLLDESIQISEHALDKKGSFHEDRLSDQEKSRLVKLQKELQTYLDKIGFSTKSNP